MHGTLLVSTANAVEDPLTLLRLALGVHVDIDNVTGGVGDDNTKRVRLASLRVSADDADLDLGDTESPSTDTESVKEALETLLDLLGLKLEHRREVDEDLVQIRVVVANNFESIEDIVDNAISLRDEILSSRDLVSETTRSDDSTGEVSLVGVHVLANTLVNVDTLVLSEDRLDVELAETSKLKLESKSRLAVTNTVILLVLGSTESVVTGVGTIAVAADECQAADTTGKELILELLNDRENIFEGLSVIAALKIADGDVDNSGELFLVLLGLGRLALTAEVGDETGSAGGVLLLLLLLKGKSLKSLGNEVLSIIDVLARNNDTLSCRLVLPLASKIRHITDRVDSLKVELASARGSRSRRSSRLQRKTKLRLSELSELEVPRNELRSIVFILVVLDLLEDVRTVSSANINLKRSQRHPRIVVSEEHGQDIENGVLGVNDLLDDIKARLSVVPTSLAVSRLDDGRTEDVLHLGGSLLKGGESTLDHDLTGLEGNLRGRTRLELSEQAESLAKVLGNASSFRLVGAVLLKDGQDKRALGADTAVRENSVNNLHDVLLVLVTQLKNNSILLRLVHEEVLNLPILLKKTLNDVKLSVLLALGVHVENLGKRGESALKKFGITSINIVLEELVESLGESLGGELSVARLAALNDLSELSVKLLWHTRVESRELGVPLAVGKLGITENLNELFEGVGHDDRVVVTQENVMEDVVEEREALSGLGTDNNRLAIGGELVDESLSLLDAAGVVKGQDTEDITSLESSSGLLDELDDTIFLSNERHVHLHDLDLGESLAGTNMGTVLDRVLDKLTGAGRSKLGRIVLLLQQAGLAVDGKTGSTNLFLPVDVVTAAVKKDKETTIAQRADTNRALGTVDEEVVAVNAGACGSELVTVTLVDEVDGEDGLENVLRGHLTLLKSGSVLSHASLAGNVSLGDGTTDNSKHGLGSLSSKTLGDKLIQPTSGDGVVLESLGLEKLDEIFDGGSEITTNTQLLKSHDHVLPRCRTVLTIGEDVAKLTV
jgi:hypothetical protein